MIVKSIPDATIEIKDLAGDDNHYAATVVSKMFENKSKVAQHKMVYDALEGKMGGVLHALSLTTLTPKN
jgi:stress-induced morphogen